jgi:hypothetical protein
MPENADRIHCPIPPTFEDDAAGIRKTVRLCCDGHRSGRLIALCLGIVYEMIRRRKAFVEIYDILLRIENTVHLETRGALLGIVVHA